MLDTILSHSHVVVFKIFSQFQNIIQNEKKWKAMAMNIHKWSLDISSKIILYLFHAGILEKAINYKGIISFLHP